MQFVISGVVSTLVAYSDVLTVEQTASFFVVGHPYCPGMLAIEQGMRVLAARRAAPQVVPAAPQPAGAAQQRERQLGLPP